MKGPHKGNAISAATTPAPIWRLLSSGRLAVPVSLEVDWKEQSSVRVGEDATGVASEGVGEDGNS
eukprot:CAMPEP_0204616270 /NCGR_PEP_ID=MMETSP0717-20131115/3549_1 /ASSEMBLY_ACC=CAM_ASM_000666 /TAXON_ID=230516 /ORGANISM="Chaetoceros curvisetus" /LENGTH=64 /DNA_ID=CAMNT_0051629443 /DNA_START=193 /DNA_END=387 /DNA_ORIENTATION=+